MLYFGNVSNCERGEGMRILYSLLVIDTYSKKKKKKLPWRYFVVGLKSDIFVDSSNDGLVKCLVWLMCNYHRKILFYRAKR